MPPHVYVHIVMYDDVRGVRGFSNRTAVVLKQLCQGEAVCFYAKAKALYLAFRK